MKPCNSPRGANARITPNAAHNMAEYDNSKWARALPYPLKDSEYPETVSPPSGVVTKTTPDIFNPDEPDEVIDIHFRMSMSQFTAIASAIDIGRDIGFGERSYELWRTWCKALIGVITVSCEDIADCIETSEAVQDAIATNENILLQQLMTNANNGINNPAVEAETDTIMTLQTQGAIGTDKDDEIKPLPGCNLDTLWAGIRDGIVQRLDDNARSVLQFLVSKADGAQRANALIGAIPIFGSMAQAVIEQMIEIAPDMLNLYESYSSIDNMDEIACEIFGLVCSECRYPTFQEVFYYYANLGITGINDLDDITIALATDLFFGSTETVALMFYHTLIAYELLVLFMGSKFYGYSGTDAIITMASLGEDFANDNWELLCDSCNESYKYKIWDLTASSTDTFVTSGYSAQGGVYLSGQGWGLQGVDATNGILSLGLAFNPSWRIRAIGWKFANQASGDGAMTANSLRPTRGTQTGAGGIAYDWGSTGWTYYENGLVSLTGYNEIAIRFASLLANNRILTHIKIIFDFDYAPDDAIPTAVATLSATVFP